MNLLEADSKLHQIKQEYLSTRDVASYLGVSINYASTILLRLAAAKRVLKIGRGKWIFNESVDPFNIPEWLTNPCPSYISLQSALYHHGMISQIPSVVYAVSLARTVTYKNSLGQFSIHHIQPKFFFGFEIVQKSHFKMAVPEKALIDFLYFYPNRSRLFRALPEIELSSSFSLKTASSIIKKIPSTRTRSLVENLFKKICIQRK